MSSAKVTGYGSSGHEAVPAMGDTGVLRISTEPPLTDDEKVGEYANIKKGEYGNMRIGVMLYFVCLEPWL